MAEKTNKRIWKLLTVKNYSDAHNHIFVGEVLQATDSYVRMKCRTFHFGKSVNNLKDIRLGETGVRIVPWNRIEMINELSAEFNYANATLTIDNESGALLKCGEEACVLTSTFAARY